MTRIRHVAICTADPWRAEAQVVEHLGLALVSRDKFNPRIGIRNGLFALRNSFLEITTPAMPAAPTQRFLDKHGEGPYMICVQVDDLAQARARAEALSIRIVLEIDRHRCGDQTVSAIHLHPADTGGALFSFEQADPADSWAYAGEAWRDYRRDHVVHDITGVVIQSPRPEILLARLGRLLDVVGHDNVLELSRSTLTVECAPEGSARDTFTAIEFSAANPSLVGSKHLIAGAHIHLV
jgi:hypothetical protein